MGRCATRCSTGSAVVRRRAGLRALLAATATLPARSTHGLGRGALRARRHGPRSIGGDAHELRPGIALFVARGTAWAADGEARAVSVLVHDPEPSSGRTRSSTCDAVETGTATAGRQFVLGATPEQRLRLGDAVHRPHPARPRARPLPHLRRGDLRARRRGLPRHRRRAGAAPRRLVRPPADDASCTASRTPARRELRAARRLPAGRLAGRGLLPRRHASPSPPEETERVPRIERTADVVWEGNVARGDGHDHRPQPARSPSCRSRCRRGSRGSQGKTSPEELLAAAHAGCLTMSLASELTGDGTPPTRLEVHVHDRDGRGRRPGPPDRRRRTSPSRRRSTAPRTTTSRRDRARRRGLSVLAAAQDAQASRSRQPRLSTLGSRRRARRGPAAGGGRRPASPRGAPGTRPCARRRSRRPRRARAPSASENASSIVCTGPAGTPDGASALRATRPASACASARLERGAQLVAVRDAALVRREALVGELGSAERLGEPPELRVVPGADHQLAVGGAVGRERLDARVHVAERARARRRSRASRSTGSRASRGSRAAGRS